MHAFCKRGQLQEALRLILLNPAQLDSYYSCYMNILQLCIDERAERPGLLVHNHAITSGFDSNLNLNTKLVIFYSKFGRIVSARNVFDRMPEKNVVSWTAMISGRFAENLFVQSALVDFHSKCGKIEDARYLFEEMSERDLVSWNAMIGGYAVQGFADASLQLFHSMMREGMFPDCFTLGSVLRALAGGSGLMKIH
ncbi:unnamed protein product [Prunus armeniaca]